MLQTSGNKRFGEGEPLMAVDPGRGNKADQKAFQELQDKGYIDKDARLTDKGLAAHGERERLANGVDISERQSTAGVPKREKLMSTSVGGKAYFGNEHMLVRGKAPGETGPFEAGGKPVEDMPSHVAKMFDDSKNGDEINPVGYSKGAGDGYHATDNNRGLVHFDDGTAVDEKYYDTIKNKFPKAKFYSRSDGKLVSAKVGDDMVAVVAPVHDVTPKGIEPMLKASAEAPKPAEAPPITPVAPEEYAMHPDLRNARPRYGYGESNYGLKFESDLDRASYILAPTRGKDGQIKKSANHDALMSDVSQSTGLTPKAIEAHGKQVRASIKEMAKADHGNSEDLTVPRQTRAPFENPEKPTKTKLSTAADDARARIQARNNDAARNYGKLGSTGGIGGKEIADFAGQMKDYAVIGAHYLEQGFTKFADWSAKMLSEFGDEIKPHLNELYSRATGVTDGDVTGVKNAYIDRQRDLLGLDARTNTPVGKSRERGWMTTEAIKRANKVADRDPSAGSKLVSSLIGKNQRRETLDPWETALLAREIAEREKTNNEAAIAHINAPEEGKALAQVDLARSRDELQQAYDATQSFAAKTKASQAMTAQKLLINRDGYSLVRMKADYSFDRNGGLPLSDAQHAEVEAAYAKLAEANRKLDELNLAQKEHEANKAASETYRRMYDETVRGGKATDFGKRVGSAMSDWGEKAIAEGRAALAAVVAEGAHGYVIPDPRIIAARVKIGAGYLARSVGSTISRVAWNAAMKKEMGEGVDLNDLWVQSHAELEKQNTEAMKVAAEKKIARIKDSDTPGKLNRREVFKLAKAHVESGVEGMESVINKVHADLLPNHPDVSVREVRDAFSDYGKARYPTKEGAAKKIRDYRQEARDLSAAEKGEPTDAQKRRLTQIQQATVKLQARIDAGDFESASRKLPVTSPAIEQATIERNRLAIEWKSKNERGRKESQPLREKAWGKFLKFRHFGVLSYPTTLAKLGASLIQQSVIIPIREIGGIAISQLMPGVASRAPREGNLSIGATVIAEKNAFMAMWREGIVGKRQADGTWRAGDMIQKLKNKPSDLEFLHPDLKALTDRDWMSYPGSIHGAIKAPILRAEFTRSMTKRVLRAMANGEDVADHVVRTRIETESIVDAMNAIYMGKNGPMDALGRYIRSSLGEGASEANMPKWSTRAVGGYLDYEMPVRRVGPNILKESVQYAGGGLVSGTVRLGLALHRGLENTTPEQHDLIMANFKKGAVIPALMLGSYLGGVHVKFGGVYTPGERRDPDELQPGDISINGYKLPHWIGVGLSHATVMSAFQVMATIQRRQAELGTESAIVAGLIGEISSMPFMNLAEKLVSVTAKSTGLFDGVEKFGAETATGLIPGIVQQSVGLFDPAKRRPTGFIEGIEKVVPGLSQNVPLNKFAQRDSLVSAIRTDRVSGNGQSPTTRRLERALTQDNVAAARKQAYIPAHVLKEQLGNVSADDATDWLERADEKTRKTVVDTKTIGGISVPITFRSAVVEKQYGIINNIKGRTVEERHAASDNLKRIRKFAPLHPGIRSPSQ